MVVLQDMQRINNQVLNKDFEPKLAKSLLTEYVVMLYKKEVIDVLQVAKALEIPRPKAVELVQSFGLDVSEDMEFLIDDLEAADHFLQASKSA